MSNSLYLPYNTDEYSAPYNRGRGSLAPFIVIGRLYCNNDERISAGLCGNGAAPLPAVTGVILKVTGRSDEGQGKVRE